MDIGTVLVVEDDDSARRATERLLNAAGVSTSTYSSAEALLAAGPIECDVCVVSDFKLPGMSGLELLVELRRRGCAHPLILTTAHDSASVRRQAELSGVAAYLAKPFRGAALLAAIRAAIEPPRGGEAG
jgi:two-component system, LuxR family, response regulator FixJ